VYIMAFPLIFPNATLPVTNEDIGFAVDHLVACHQPSWTERDAELLVRAYTTGQLQAELPAFKATVFGTDFIFVCDTRKSAAALAALGVDVFVYQFDFHDTSYLDPRSKECQNRNERGCGIAHTAENPYVWNRASDTAAERDVSRFFGEWWTNFAKDGTPSASGAPQWLPYNASSQAVMKISESPSVVLGLPPFSQCAIWDTLPPYMSV